MSNPYTPAQKQAYLASIPKPPESVVYLQDIMHNTLDLWLNAMDNMSPDDLIKLTQQTQDAIYGSADKAKDIAAMTIGGVAAIINVVPVFGQIIGAILSALAAILKAVPNARSALGPQFSTHEAAEWATYRGFTRRYMVVHECIASDEGKASGYGIGGPGTPSYCNETYGGLTLKNKFKQKVNNSLLNIGKYLNVPNILNYFPEGPAAKNPSLEGDKSPALYLIEIFDDVPPYESVSQNQQAEIYKKLTEHVDKTIDKKAGFDFNSINWGIVGIGVSIWLFLLNRRKN